MIWFARGRVTSHTKRSRDRKIGRSSHNGEIIASRSWLCSSCYCSIKRWDAKIFLFRRRDACTSTWNWLPLRARRHQLLSVKSTKKRATREEKHEGEAGKIEWPSERETPFSSRSQFPSCCSYTLVALLLNLKHISSLPSVRGVILGYAVGEWGTSEDGRKRNEREGFTQLLRTVQTNLQLNAVDI